MAIQNYRLQNAVQISLANKVMKQDVQAMENIVEMSKDVAKMTGIGQNFDLKV